MPDKQFLLFLDDVRLPADALVGEEDAALAQLFAGLNPERIMAAAGSVGMGRYALDKAVAYANEREVWGKPIGTHQGLVAPAGQGQGRARAGQADDAEGGVALRRRRRHGRRRGGEHGQVRRGRGGHRRASTRRCRRTAATASPSEYGLGNLLIGARVARIAPVSREMILNFVAQFSLGLPKSY